MRRIELCLGLMAALVFSIAATTSASAASFLSSAQEPLLSENVSSQVFVTEAGTTNCSEAAVTAGESSGAEASIQEATIEYRECTAFGFITVTISPAEYVFSANGEVHIEKLISIKTTGCEVSVPAQAVNKVDYATKGNNILLEPLVTGIKYTAAGSLCKKTGTFTNGTYQGHAEVMIPSGTLSFMTKGGPPAIRVTRIAGRGKLVTECDFIEKGEACAIRIEAFFSGGRSLEPTLEKVFSKAGEFKFIMPGKKLPERECKIGLKLAVGESCADEVEYVGLAKPMPGEFIGTFEAEAREEVTLVKTAIEKVKLTT